MIYAKGLSAMKILGGGGPAPTEVMRETRTAEKKNSIYAMSLLAKLYCSCPNL